MEEKILIKGEKANYILATLAIILTGLLVFMLVWYIFVMGNSFYSESVEDGDWDYVFTSIVPFFGSFSFLPFLIIAIAFYFWVSKMEIVVTDKRVYGKAAFGKRVDLPIDSVSAVGTSFFKGIDVGTSSGRIHFKFLKNQEKIHMVLSDLLLKRQREKMATVSVSAPSNINSSSADELKKYKELLDSGVITQEEFDAKKKQLLGL